MFKVFLIYIFFFCNHYISNYIFRKLCEANVQDEMYVCGSGKSLLKLELTDSNNIVPDGPLEKILSRVAGQASLYQHV